MSAPTETAAAPAPEVKPEETVAAPATETTEAKPEEAAPAPVRCYLHYIFCCPDPRHSMRVIGGREGGS